MIIQAQQQALESAALVEAWAVGVEPSIAWAQDLVVMLMQAEVLMQAKVMLVVERWVLEPALQFLLA
ncbi:MAG: hypothetical protein P4L87_24240 [Formivibrio sp.]|nr:hypothetical protein [Formivibrio sp.]